MDKLEDLILNDLKKGANDYSKNNFFISESSEVSEYTVETASDISDISESTVKTASDISDLTDLSFLSEGTIEDASEISDISLTEEIELVLNRPGKRTVKPKPKPKPKPLPKPKPKPKPLPKKKKDPDYEAVKKFNKKYDNYIDRDVLDYNTDNHNKKVTKNFINTALTKRDPKYFPEKLKNNIKMLTFSKTKNDIMLYGSANYRAQKWYGDFDLIENFKGVSSPNAVINKFIKSLKKMVNDINKKKLHYFSEFKAGYDTTYNLSIGKMNNGIYTQNPKLKQKVKILYDKNLLNKKEYNTINKILNKKVISPSDVDILIYILRQKGILRWSLQEINRGSKKISNGNISLQEAVSMDTPVKIDEIIIFDGKFIEMTNFVLLSYFNEKNKLKHINLSPCTINGVLEDLKKDIDKHFYSTLHYNPFKCAKRMFSICRLMRKKDDIFDYFLQLLIPLLGSDLSKLYQMKSELESVIRVAKITKAPPIASINEQLSSFKMDLPNLLFIPNKHLKNLQKMIQQSINNKSKKIDYIKKLEKLKIEYIDILDQATIIEFNNLGLNPMPKQFLPSYTRYKQREIPIVNAEAIITKYKVEKLNL